MDDYLEDKGDCGEGIGKILVGKVVMACVGL